MLGQEWMRWQTCMEPGGRTQADGGWGTQIKKKKVSSLLNNYGVALPKGCRAGSWVRSPIVLKKEIVSEGILGEGMDGIIHAQNIVRFSSRDLGDTEVITSDSPAVWESSREEEFGSGVRLEVRSTAEKLWKRTELQLPRSRPSLLGFCWEISS